MADAKKKLRCFMREGRLALPGLERVALSELACARLLHSLEWRDASVVALYMAVRGEADCGLLLLQAWRARKKVLLPLCSPDKQGEMRFVSCPGPSNLRPGAYGILEPVEDENDSGDHVPDLIVVPGLAFDCRGNRLGMGGGYYDRLLAKQQYANSLSIGFAFSFQVVENLPVSEQDVPVRALCTDMNFTWISS